MHKEIASKPKEESKSKTSPNNSIVTLNRGQLVNLCALGLGTSFFLPWVRFFLGSRSGFDLQKYGGEQRLLWTIPIFCVLTIFAGVTNRSQNFIGRITGALPLLVGLYWFRKFGNDLFHMLTYGAYLSVIFGVALFILPRKSK